MYHIQLNKFKSSRKANKAIVNLQSKLTAIKDSNMINEAELATKNKQLMEVELRCIKSERSLSNEQKKYKSALKQEKAERFQENRHTSKQIVNATRAPVVKTQVSGARVSKSVR